MKPHPRVFISHASEDKDRFVNRFAGLLRDNGVDAWLDKWEMLPGDSLVDKIFEEGLKEAEAVIVVLSHTSVSKSWVREELNAAIVKRINTGSRLIPVVIDECEVPEALKSTLWERIRDIQSYQESLDRILAAIFGTYDRPAIGTAPAYADSFSKSIGSLNNVDSLVLRLACEWAVANANDQINGNSLYVTNGQPLLPPSELADALEILEQNYFIQVHRMLGGSLNEFRLTTHGFEEYALACIPNYENVVRDVVSSIVNMDINLDTAISEKTGYPLFVVQHVLQVLEDEGHLKISKFMSGPQQVYMVAASLRRALTK